MRIVTRPAVGFAHLLVAGKLGHVIFVMALCAQSLTRTNEQPFFGGLVCIVTTVTLPGLGRAVLELRLGEKVFVAIETKRRHGFLFELWMVGFVWQVTARAIP